MLEIRSRHLTSGGPRLEGEPNILKQDTQWTELTFYLGGFHILCHWPRGRGVSEIVTLLNKLI